MERTITYAQAIRKATEEEMARDSGILVYGIGVDDFKGTYGTTSGLLEKFGPERVFDTPLAEDGMTGLGIGMALAGLRPIHVHIRMDFLLLAMNQIVNIAAKARYMYGGQVSIPLVIRSIIGRSWGQGAQHSQALHSFFAHVPGLRVVAPSTPYDAKGLLVQSLRQEDPVLFIEHRLLHSQRGPVPEGSFTVPFGKGRILSEGEDITITGISYATVECLRASELLRRSGVRAEVVDCVSLRPLDLGLIFRSARKTGRLLVVDNGWTFSGMSAEILAQVAERPEGSGISLRRLGFAPVSCPTTRPLEDEFYPDARKIASLAHEMVRGHEGTWPKDLPAAQEIAFKGPF